MVNLHEKHDRNTAKMLTATAIKRLEQRSGLKCDAARIDEIRIIMREAYETVLQAMDTIERLEKTR